MASASRSTHPGVGELGDFTTSDRRLVVLSLFAVVVGVVAAFVAAALYDLIGLFTNLFYFGRWSIQVVPPENTWGVLSILVPVAGGLVIGLMARYGSPKIRGHGIPEAIESILIHRSRIEPRVTVLKPVSSAISIGTGGPFGAEGPIIMTGAAFGSVYAQFLHLTDGERKTLLVAGAAAGMAAIFNTPLAAILLAGELLLFEWKPRSLLPVGVASGVAAFASWGLVPAHGTGPLFPMAATGVPSPALLGGSVIIGLAAGGLAVALSFSVYFFEDAFRRLPVHWMWWPAIGGIAVGVGGLIAVGVLGVGYGGICSLLSCSNPAMLVGSPTVTLALAALVSLLIVKWLVWSVALGSGTSGGILAPLLLIGGSLGALFSLVLPGGSEPVWALLAMTATLGSTMRAPLTGVVFALELTHDLDAALPLLIAVFVADGIAVLAMKRDILTEKIARRGVHVAREYSVDPLEQIPVRSIAHATVVELPPSTLAADARRALARKDGEEAALVTRRTPSQPWQFQTRTDLQRYLDAGGDPSAPIGDVARVPEATAYPEEPSRTAIDRLTSMEASAIPVVAPDDPLRVIGFVTREGPFEARRIWHRTESHRERTLPLPWGSVWARLRDRRRP